MIVTEFRMICRKHDLDKTAAVKGHLSKRQLEQHIQNYKDQMAEFGCTDYSITYSVSHNRSVAV